jgi:hypothetical protein
MQARQVRKGSIRGSTASCVGIGRVKQSVATHALSVGVTVRCRHHPSLDPLCAIENNKLLCMLQHMCALLQAATPIRP